MSTDPDTYFPDTDIRSPQWSHQWPLPAPVELAGDQMIYGHKTFEFPPDFTVEHGTLAARPPATDAPFYWADDMRRLYVSDNADWWPADAGNGVLNGADYGISATPVDCTPNLQALGDDATADNLAMFIPPTGNSDYIKVKGTVELGNFTKGPIIFGSGGRGRSFTMAGGTEIANITNALPIFHFDANTGPTTERPINLANLSLYGYALYYKGGSGGGGIQIQDCGFLATNTVGCIVAVDTFWWRLWRNGFSAVAVGSPALTMRGENPTINENISYLFDFLDNIWSYGGIRYEQNVNFAPNSNPGMSSVINQDTENFPDQSYGLFDLVRGGGVTDVAAFTSVTARGIRNFDSAGAVRVPIVRCGAGTTIFDWTIGESLYYGACVVATTAAPVPVGIRVINPARNDSLITDNTGALINCLATKEKNGGRVYYGSTGTPDLYGSSFRYGTDTVDRLGITAAGQLRGSDGANPYDAQFARDSAGVFGVRAGDALRHGRGATGARPNAVNVGAGTEWFDTTLGHAIWSNGAIWVDATGAPT